MNEYLAQSNYSAVNRNNSVTDSSIFDSINPTDNTNNLDDEYLDKPVSELCIHIFNIISGANKPFGDKIVNLYEDLTNKVIVLENIIKNLEVEHEKYT